MGFPLKNNYALFQALRRDTVLDPNARAPKELAQYDLFAFVLHDPSEHSEFHEALSEKFVDLDSSISGQKLLFFCLTDPPAEWLKMASKRPYLVTGWGTGKGEAEALSHPSATIHTRDQSLSTHTLARFLEIPTDELPCIYVTNNFYSPNGIYFQTHPTLLEEQMRTLGQIAESHGTDSQEEIYQRIQDEVPRSDIAPTPHSVTGASDPSLNNLSAVIAEAMSLLVPHSHDSEMICREIRAGLQKRIDAVAQSGDEPLESTLEKLALAIQFRNRPSKRQSGLPSPGSGTGPSYMPPGAFPHAAMPSIAPLPSSAKAAEPVDARRMAAAPLPLVAAPSLQVAIGSHLLDSESTKMLDTGNAVLSYLQFEMGGDCDFSPAVMQFAKVFEREINLSLVQWMRACCGVSMPEYFNRVQPGFAAQWNTLDFNRNGGNGKLQLPTLGQSVRLYEAYLESPNKNQIPLSASAKTAVANGRNSKWDKLARIRNASSHTELASLGMAEKVCSIFGEFSKGNLFDDLCSLRGDLNGATARFE